MRNKRKTELEKHGGEIALRIAVIVLAALVLAGSCLLAFTVPLSMWKALAKEILGENLGVIRMMGPWKKNAQLAYEQMKETREAIGDDAIAWLVQTDLHGRNMPIAKWMYKKDQSVRNIVLGDVTTDYFNEKELTAFAKSMEKVGNKICVYGNHDICTKSDEQATYDLLMRSLASDGVKGNNERGYFTVTDDALKVKYIVVSPYEIDPQARYSMSVRIGSEQMTWLLNEMSADDGYDIIVLMHQLFTNSYVNRSGVPQQGGDAPAVLQELWRVMKDRRNGRSGEIVDDDGVSHAYDFTGTKTDLLCSLHGHWHEEMMLTEESMTAYAARWLGHEYSCAFGLIDRENKRMYIWQFDRTKVYDRITLEI